MSFISLIYLLTLVAALGGTAWNLVRRLSPNTASTALVALTGVVSVLLTTAIPVGLHYAGLPVSAANLALAHGGSFLAVFILTRQRVVAGFDPDSLEIRVLALACVLLAVMLFPFTRLAGIDTYRWQALASMVVGEQRIPWLVHPAGLLGFTPYAYPVSHPMLLATVKLLSGLGVDGSWYLTSLFIGFLALASMAWLARSYGLGGRWVAVTAFLYVFSPVCMRYFHWATGRGLFLALMPLAWVALLEPSPRRAWPGLAAVGALLLLSHKTALVAVPLLVLIRLAAVGVPRRRGPAVALAAAFLAAAAVLVWIFAQPGIGRMAWGGLAAAGRIGWPVVAVVPALWIVAGRLDSAASRRLFLGVILGLPLVFMRDMYGTLILATPLIMLVADGARTVVGDLRPRLRAAVMALAIMLTLSGAVGVVVKRSREAMPPAVHAAAVFIDRRDPQGPFQIVASGRASGQIRAYTRGSRPMAVYGKTVRSIRFSPSLSGMSPGAAVRLLTVWLRHIIKVEVADLAWHDPSRQVYYVKIDGAGRVPAGAVCVYDRDGVAVYLSK